VGTVRAEVAAGELADAGEGLGSRSEVQRFRVEPGHRLLVEALPAREAAGGQARRSPRLHRQARIRGPFRQRGVVERDALLPEQREHERRAAGRDAAPAVGDHPARIEPAPRSCSGRGGSESSAPAPKGVAGQIR